MLGFLDWFFAGIDRLVGLRHARVRSFRWALCLLHLGAAAAVAQARVSSPPPLGRLVDVGGYRVHLYCTGSGSPTTVIAGAGYSFDWDLVQSAASNDGRVCSYDPSGSAWSDTPPTPPTCDSHVAELHRLLQAAGIDDHLILVGQSIGAVFARLYATRFPQQVVGMVIVDHAAIIRMAAPPIGRGGAAVLPPGVALGRGVTLPPGVKLSPPVSGSPAAADSPYHGLPARDRALHEWADTLPTSTSPRAQRAMFDACIQAVETEAARFARPLGRTPLVVISLPIPDSGYQALQRRLLALSSNSTQIVADSSGHLIHIDRPGLVAHAISIVRTDVRSQRNVP